MRRTPDYYVAVSIQAVLLKRIMQETTEGKDLAALARAWDVLEERKRIMRMQPKPRDMEVNRTRDPLNFPVKESLLIESTPRETTPERGQS